MSTNVCAKFRCAPLRIKKALGIFREHNNNNKKKNNNKKTGFLWPAFRVRKLQRKKRCNKSRNAVSDNAGEENASHCRDEQWMCCCRTMSTAADHASSLPWVTAANFPRAALSGFRAEEGANGGGEPDLADVSSFFSRDFGSPAAGFSAPR